MNKVKKKKNNYNSTVAGKLSWRILLTLVVVMGVLSFVIYSLSTVVLISETEDYYENVLKASNEKVRRIISDVYVAAVNTVPQVEDNLDNPDRLQLLMERLVEHNPRIRSCGISFVEGYYPQKGKWFCPYAHRVDSATVEGKIVGDAEHDYLKTDWFHEALAAKKGYWCKPYFEDVDGVTPLVSYLVPIRDKSGNAVAVFGVDLSLEWLQNHLLKVSKKQLKSDDSDSDDMDDQQQDTAQWQKGRYIFIIDSDGTYLAHPDEKRIINENYFTYAEATPDTIDDYVGHMMTSGKKGYYPEYGGEEEDLTIEGTECYIFFKPVEHTDWSVGLVMRSLTVQITGYVLAGLLLFFVFIALIVVLLVSFVTIRQTTKPLNQLAQSADEVAKGNFNTWLPWVSSHDEVRHLRDSFRDMQLSLARYVDELQVTTAQKASFESELKVAHDIQMSMLPKIFPPYPDRNDVDIYAQLTPAKAVGGDLFDFFIRDDQLFFCIGDVSGKGVPAALVMAVTRSLFRNISTQVDEPHVIVGKLNDVLAEENETNMFVTAFVGVLNLKTGLLRYCNAGHDAPLIVEGRQCSTVEVIPNLPIGVMPDWNFTTQETQMAPGSVIFLYTDGLTEAEDIFHNQFGEERVVSVLSDMKPQEGCPRPQKIIEAQTDAVHTFVGEAEQSDDITMLAIRFV